MDEVNEKWHNTTNFYMSAAAFFDGGLVKEIARSVSGYGTDLKFLQCFSFNPVFEND